jgi:pentatricopeptide repeat protein
VDPSNSPSPCKYVSLARCSIVLLVSQSLALAALPVTRPMRAAARGLFTVWRSLSVLHGESHFALGRGRPSRGLLSGGLADRWRGELDAVEALSASKSAERAIRKTIRGAMKGLRQVGKLPKWTGLLAQSRAEVLTAFRPAVVTAVVRAATAPGSGLSDDEIEVLFAEAVGSLRPAHVREWPSEAAVWTPSAEHFACGTRGVFVWWCEVDRVVRTAEQLCRDSLVAGRPSLPLVRLAQLYACIGDVQGCTRTVKQLENVGARKDVLDQARAAWEWVVGRCGVGSSEGCSIATQIRRRLREGRVHSAARLVLCESASSPVSRDFWRDGLDSVSAPCLPAPLAQEVFDQCIQQGCWDGALELLRAGVVPSRNAGSLAWAASVNGLETFLKSSEAFSVGKDSDARIASAWVRLRHAQGDLAGCEREVQRCSEVLPASAMGRVWDALVDAHADLGSPLSTERVLLRRMEQGVGRATVGNARAVVRAFARDEDLLGARDVIARVQRSGSVLEASGLWEELALGCSSVGLPTLAEATMRSMQHSPDRPVATSSMWGAILEGYAAQGMWSEAASVMERMVQAFEEGIGPRPVVRHWAALHVAYRTAGLMDEAKHVLSRMQGTAIGPEPSRDAGTPLTLSSIADAALTLRSEAFAPTVPPGALAWRLAREEMNDVGDAVVRCLGLWRELADERLALLNQLEELRASTFQGSSEASLGPSPEVLDSVLFPRSPAAALAQGWKTELSPADALEALEPLSKAIDEPIAPRADAPAACRPDDPSFVSPDRACALLEAAGSVEDMVELFEEFVSAERSWEASLSESPLPPVHVSGRVERLCLERLSREGRADLVGRILGADRSLSSAPSRVPVGGNWRENVLSWCTGVSSGRVMRLETWDLASSVSSDRSVRSRALAQREAVFEAFGEHGELERVAQSLRQELLRELREIDSKP